MLARTRHRESTAAAAAAADAAAAAATAATRAPAPAALASSSLCRAETPFACCRATYTPLESAPQRPPPLEDTSQKKSMAPRTSY